jgi:hypothetical protein
MEAFESQVEFGILVRDTTRNGPRYHGRVGPRYHGRGGPRYHDIFHRENEQKGGFPIVVSRTRLGCLAWVRSSSLKYRGERR